MSKCRSQWPCGLRRGSWLVGCWDRGFESRSRHGCLSASFCVVLSCVGRNLATGWSLVQGVLPYVWIAQETSYMRGGHGPSRTVEPREEDMSKYVVYEKKIFRDFMCFHSIFHFHFNPCNDSEEIFDSQLCVTQYSPECRICVTGNFPSMTMINSCDLLEYNHISYLCVS
jgi:hypothetical protein